MVDTTVMATPTKSGSVRAAMVWLICLFAVAPAALAEDWPMYRHDAARSGVTSESIRPPLSECWVFQPKHPPQTAWGDPKAEPVEGYLELRRMHFDDVFHVALAQDGVYFGSSADNKVYCLDADSGQLRWSRITRGPVRLAPTVSGGRVYAGSDDGYAYCLDAEDGSLQWEFHAAPADDHVLGHGRMISLWPLRTGILVDQGVAYFGAGIFPAEGVFLYAVDALSGREIWRNDSCGEIPQSRISPQGYLLASETNLYVPMGRVSPSAFSRQDGSLKHSAYFGKSIGGAYALLAGEHVYTGTEELVAYQKETRDRFAVFAGQKLVVRGDVAYVATQTELMALDRKKFPAASRKVYTLKLQQAELVRLLRTQRDDQNLQARAREVAAQLKAAEAEFNAAKLWSVACDCHDALILAGQVLFAGGSGKVTALDAASGQSLWTGSVEGTAKGLAVGNGRLLVSTDAGHIYCYGPADSPQHGTVVQRTGEYGLGESSTGKMFARAAEEILEGTGTERGYCLVVGLESGRLAVELAKRSDLMIYAVDPDPDKVHAVQEALDAASLHGARICVECWPVDQIAYSDYFANLIVFESAMLDGKIPCRPADVLRMLKPLGGTIVLGSPAGSEPLPPRIKQEWQNAAELTGADCRDHGHWATYSRGPLPGAGQWTHLYGNAANTACGDDTLVQSPLGVLWFGQPGPGSMVNRHARAASPLCKDGRLFIQGENVVMAHDPYNGLKLWEREIPGALRTNASHDGSNLAVNGRSLFVAVADRCLALDPASGQTTATYQVPPSDDGRAHRWGYVACTEDTLYGSAGTGPTVSQSLFAVDLASGQLRIIYDGRRIQHNTVAMADGRIYLVDANVTDAQRQQAIEAQRLWIAGLPESERAQAEKALGQPDIRLVVAADAKSGEILWRRPMDLAHCGGRNLAALVQDGVMLIFGVHLDGHYWQQFFAGEFDTRRVMALSTDDGSLLWSRPVGYRVRPLVIDNTLHTEPWAFDLETGEPKTRVHPVTGQTERWQLARPGHHCGLPVASPNCMFFRSLVLGYYDLVKDSGTMHFGAQRPGCWINFIPAAGLLLMPEASAGCMCAFPNMCSVAFKPRQVNKAFSYFSSPGPMTPVQRLAINFGAPGDRRDSEGNLWLGYPRPKGSLVLQFEVDTAFYPGGLFTTRNSTYTPIAGTEMPWLFASAARGLRKCVVPLRTAEDGTALYRVRLAMCDPENDQPGRRVFDVKIQDDVVLAGLDLAARAGGRDRAVVHEFNGIEVRDKLTVELVPKVSNPTPDRAPILQGLEILCQEVTSLGCDPPDFLLSSLEPEKTGDLRLANLRNSPFQGTVRIKAPEGIRVTPGEQAIQLPTGQRRVIRLEAHVRDDLPAGKYPVTVELVDIDGAVAATSTATIEHLGRRGRVVLQPVEDASVQQRYPDLNKGKAGVLLVDGGNRVMNDTDHAVGLLKFELDIPGKPVRVSLRLHNDDNPSGDSGRLCLVKGPWRENAVTYATRPELGDEIARLGRVSENQTVELSLPAHVAGGSQLSLAIDPTSCDGIYYLSREGQRPPELIVDYEPN